MGRRYRRRSDLTASDLHFMVTTKAGSIVAMFFGLVGVGFYHLLEPSKGNPANPITMLGHIFWEATAVRFYWPFLGLALLGAGGFAFAMLCDVFTRKSL